MIVGIPKSGHPTECPKCGDKDLVAVFTICRSRQINDDGTLGDYTDGGTHDLSYYECGGCDSTFDIEDLWVES